MTQPAGFMDGARRMMRTDKCREHLKYVFSDDELKEHSRELARQAEAKSSTEQEKKQ